MKTPGTLGTLAAIASALAILPVTAASAPDMAAALTVAGGPLDGNAMALVLPASISQGEVAPTPSCGPEILKSNGVAWECTFADHFSGTSLNLKRWSAMTTAKTGVVTPECRVDSPNNIVIKDGTLRLSVRRETEPFICATRTGGYVTDYTGGAVTTYNKFAQTRGRFEIRAKFPDAKVQGLHSALWMWPQTMKYGNASGEIDIAEFRTAIPDRVIPYVHYISDGADPTKTNNWCMLDHPERFHTYVLRWTKSRMTFLYDGKVCLVNNWNPAAPLVKPQPFDQPFAIILNQGLGINGNEVDSHTPLPARMIVDYVRAWS